MWMILSILGGCLTFPRLPGPTVIPDNILKVRERGPSQMSWGKLPSSLNLELIWVSFNIKIQETSCKQAVPRTSPWALVEETPEIGQLLISSRRICCEGRATPEFPSGTSTARYRFSNFSDHCSGTQYLLSFKGLRVKKLPAATIRFLK